jgi:hypothetical protein
MQVKTRIKASGLKTNHNETLGRALVPNQEQGLKGKTMKLTMFRHALEGRSLLLAPLLAGMLLLLLPLGVRADSFTVDLLRGYPET